MDSTIDATHFVRSRRTPTPGPAQIPGPLANLADAAVRIASGSGTVAVTRGFDRNSRQRARALRTHLGERDIAAIEVTPATGSERLLAGNDIDAVINLVGAGSWLPYRLAARLRAPLLIPHSEDEQTSLVERDVIGMLSATCSRDAALSHVTVRPEGTGPGSLTIHRDAAPLTVADGWCTITLRDHQLEVTVGRPGFAEQTFATAQARIETSGGAHRLIRDELPIAELENELTVTAEPSGLIIHRV